MAGGNVFIPAFPVLDSAGVIVALGYTPVNKAGDTGIGALSVTSLALGGATIGANGLAVTGAVAIDPGVTSPVMIGRNASFTTYGAISFNGTFSDTGMAGFFGGGGSTLLYFNSPSDIVMRPGGVAGNNILRIQAGGLAMTAAYIASWYSDAVGGTADLGFSRNAAGRMEINSSAAGTFRDLKLRDLYVNNATFMTRGTGTWTDGAGVSVGTLTNAPAAGNPTKWIAIDDNGTTRKIPAW